MWAVGGNYGKPLAMRLSGGAWQRTRLPRPPAGDSDLLAGVATDPAGRYPWTVGEIDGHDGYAYRPVVYSWAGDRWNSVPLPDRLQQPQDFLDSVAVAGPNDVWVAGRGGSPRVNEGDLFHWDGRAWQSGNGLRLRWLNITSLAAPGSDDVVAAGYFFEGVTETLPFVERWDGSAWNDMKVPAVDGAAGNNRFAAVSATGPDNVWAVGIMSPHADAIGLIDHWNGTRWSTFHFRVSGYANVQLYGVDFASPHAGWAVGTAFQKKTSLLFALQWTSQGWHLWRLRQFSRPYSQLTGVSTGSAGRAYAVGYRLLSSGQAHPLVFRWDGRDWSRQHV